MTTATRDSLPDFPADHRGSPLPTARMIAARTMELRKRRGLMIALVGVYVGLPSLFLAVRLISHWVAPTSYGPAGGWDIFTALIAGMMPTFGFVVAATLGANAGSSDLTEGVFRHLVVTGRSRIALYFARIPAGLALLTPIVGSGVAVVCAVCVFAAPTQLNFNGVNVPSGLSEAGLVAWSQSHVLEVLCNFDPNPPVQVVPSCGPAGQGTIVRVGPGQSTHRLTKAQLAAAAAAVVRHDYQGYRHDFLRPPVSVMLESLLWLEMVSALGLAIGLGLSSLMGQRTVPVVLLIVFEVVLTPLLSNHVIPHVINLQRGLVGLAFTHVEPGGLPNAFVGGGGGQGSTIISESTLSAYLVIAAWFIGWTALGAWKMNRRDA